MNRESRKQPEPAATSSPIDCLKLTGGLFSRTTTGVVIEKELPVYINGEQLVTASIAPAMEAEFVTGYLFGQGFIDNIEELESVNIEDNAARVTVKDVKKLSQRTRKAHYRIVSGGGKAIFFDETSYPEIHTDMQIGKKEIFKAMNTIFEKAEIYRDTEGVHAAGLFTAEAVPICIVEDIGRHNTLDKLIGYALINDIDCADTFLVSTGRMASEMVAKICRAKIPVIATKTAVTDKGLEIGRKCGLTIIGFVRDIGTRINTDMETRIITEPGMKIYTNVERILCE